MKKVLLASGLFVIVSSLSLVEAKPISVKLLQGNILNQYYDQGYEFYDQNRAGYDSTYDALEETAKDYFEENVKEVKLQHGDKKLDLNLENRTANVKGEDESAQYYRGDISNNNRALNITNNHTGQTVFDGTSGTTTEGRNVYQINNHNGVKIKNLEERDGRNVEQVQIKKIGESNSGVTVRNTPSQSLNLRSSAPVTSEVVNVQTGNQTVQVKTYQEPSTPVSTTVTADNESVIRYCPTTQKNAAIVNNLDVIAGQTITYIGSLNANNVDIYGTLVVEGDLNINNLDVAPSGKLLVLGNLVANNTGNQGAIYVAQSLHSNQLNYEGNGIFEAGVRIAQDCVNPDATIEQPTTAPTHKTITITNNDDNIQGETLTGKTTIYNGTEITEIRTKGEANREVSINSDKEVVVSVNDNGNTKNVDIQTTDQAFIIESDQKTTNVNVSTDKISVNDGSDTVEVTENTVKVESSNGETVEVKIEGGFLKKLLKSIFSIFQ